MAAATLADRYINDWLFLPDKAIALIVDEADRDIAPMPKIVRK